MRRSILRSASRFAALAALAWSGNSAFAGDLSKRLLQQAPGLNAEVLELAVSAYDCMARKRLLYAEHVAHGRGSGDNLATEFSNVEGSHQTSLGLFLTDQTYYGANGYSLRMDGLDPGFNDLARQRAIVMHGAPYVDPEFARTQGRLGRSHGCPAVRDAVARPLINQLRHGQLLFAYYPDPAWLANARSLSCLRVARAGQAAGAAAAP